jgi:hypothetical protein
MALITVLDKHGSDLFLEEFNPGRVSGGSVIIGRKRDAER